MGWGGEGAIILYIATDGLQPVIEDLHDFPNEMPTLLMASEHYVAMWVFNVSLIIKYLSVN